MVEKEWIEACQIEQNSSMETARTKLRSEQLAALGDGDSIVLRSGNRHVIVAQNEAVPQYYEPATINMQLVVVREKHSA